MAILTTTTCILYILASDKVYEVNNLTPKDAAAKYWEYAVHENYAEIAMEAVYCNKKLVMILKNTNLDALPNAADMPQGAVPGETPKPVPTTPTFQPTPGSPAQ